MILNLFVAFAISTNRIQALQKTTSQKTLWRQLLVLSNLFAIMLTVGSSIPPDREGTCVQCRSCRSQAQDVRDFHLF